MYRRRFLIGLAAATGVALLIGLPRRRARAQTPTPTRNVAETIAAQPFTAFAQLLAASPHLAEALADPALRWTVLLPADSAFASDSTLDTLLNDAARRDTFLARHLIPGAVSSGRLWRNSGAFLGTLADGAVLHIMAEDERVWLGGALVSERDIAATNGVVHHLDAIPAVVEVPGAPADAVSSSLAALIADEAARAETRLSGVLQGFQAANDASLLAGLGALTQRFTLFAPTNDAFTRLIRREGITAECALEAGHAMTQVFANHLIPGRFTLEAFTRLAAAQADGRVQFVTLNGRSLTFGASGLVDVDLAQADIAAANGIMHIIEDVLVPPGL